MKKNNKIHSCCVNLLSAQDGTQLKKSYFKSRTTQKKLHLRKSSVFTSLHLDYLGDADHKVHKSEFVLYSLQRTFREHYRVVSGTNRVYRIDVDDSELRDLRILQQTRPAVEIVDIDEIQRYAMCDFSHVEPHYFITPDQLKLMAQYYVSKKWFGPTNDWINSPNQNGEGYQFTLSRKWWAVPYCYIDGKPYWVHASGICFLEPVMEEDKEFIRKCGIQQIEVPVVLRFSSLLKVIDMDGEPRLMIPHQYSYLFGSGEKGIDYLWSGFRSPNKVSGTYDARINWPLDEHFVEKVNFTLSDFVDTNILDIRDSVKDAKKTIDLEILQSSYENLFITHFSNEEELVKFFKKIHDDLIDVDFNALIFLGESKETLEMIIKTITTIPQIIIAVKRGRFKKALSLLRTVWRGNERPFQLDKEIATPYLWWQFGIKPLLDDVQAAIRVFSQSSDRVYVHTRVRGALSIDQAANGPDMPLFSQLKTHSLCASNKLRITVDKSVVTFSAYYLVEDKLRFLLSSLGLTQICRGIWELLPLSFVVDWFIQIRSYLTDLNLNRAGLSFCNGSLSIRQDISYHDDELSIPVGHANAFCRAIVAPKNHLLENEEDIPAYLKCAELTSMLVQYGSALGPFNPNLVQRGRGLDEGKTLTLAALFSAFR